MQHNKVAAQFSDGEKEKSGVSSDSEGIKMEDSQISALQEQLDEMRKDRAEKIMCDCRDDRRCLYVGLHNFGRDFLAQLVARSMGFVLCGIVIDHLVLCRDQPGQNWHKNWSEPIGRTNRPASSDDRWCLACHHCWP